MSSSLPALCSGVMREHFQMEGISKVGRDKLNRSHSGYMSMCDANFRNLFSIPSNPGLLEILSSLMAFITSMGVIVLKEKVLWQGGAILEMM